MNANDNLNLMNEMGNKGYESMNKLGELNLRVWEKLASRHMEAMKSMMEQGKRQMELATEAKDLGDVKGFGDIMKAQTELARESGERLMEETKANLAIAGEVRDEYRSFIETGMSEMSAEVRKVAPLA